MVIYPYVLCYFYCTVECIGTHLEIVIKNSIVFLEKATRLLR